MRFRMAKVYKVAEWAKPVIPASYAEIGKARYEDFSKFGAIFFGTEIVKFLLVTNQYISNHI